MQFEYGCKGTKHFFTPTGKAAEAIGGKTYVLHLVSILTRHVNRALKPVQHSSEVNGYVQDK